MQTEYEQQYSMKLEDGPKYKEQVDPDFKDRRTDWKKKNLR